MKWLKTGYRFVVILAGAVSLVLFGLSALTQLSKEIYGIMHLILRCFS